MWTIVDLGTKAGGAIDHFRKIYDAHFQNGLSIAPRSCLGIDRDDRNRTGVEKRGYNFMKADILSADFGWPEAEFYTAVHILEYLPSIHSAVATLDSMLKAAKRGAWVRISSHERDENALAQLRRHGLRFAWTEWSAHRTEVSLARIRSVAMRHGKISLRELPRTVIGDSSDGSIVPVTAPRNCPKYDQSMGLKPKVAFDPPIVPEWDVFIEKHDE